MEHLIKYIYDTLGISIQLVKLDSQELGSFPFYLRSTFQFFRTRLFDRNFILAYLNSEQELTGLAQIEKQLNQVSEIIGKPIVLILDDLPAITRKRMVEKGINFIVPGKQMYLPAVLIDFNEVFKKTSQKKEQLMPSAQVILLYQLLKRNINIEELPFKQLAEDLHYSAMTITKAAENLKDHELCQINGSKEKYIHFISPPSELWEKSLPVLVDPVIKRVYVDDYPKDFQLLKSNITALSEYSNLNPETQVFRAIDKSLFYGLKRNEGFVDLNEYAGPICLELWKYNPATLAENGSSNDLVDPISLYISLKDSGEERVQIELEKMIQSIIW